MNAGRSSAITYWRKNLTELFEFCPPKDFLEAIWGWNSMVAERHQAGLTKVNFNGDLQGFQFGNSLWFPQWHLESLTNRFLAFHVDGKRSKRTLRIREWGGFAKLLNTMNRLENVESLVDVSEGGIIDAMQRLFWPQYSWQIGYVKAHRVSRSWIIYGGPECSRVFLEKYDVELIEFLRISFMLFAGATSNPIVNERALIGTGASTLDVMRAINVISKEFNELTEIACDQQLELENSVYNRSAIRENPVIRIVGRNGRLVFAPLPELILARITDALYYDIVNDGASRHEAGVAFEELSYEMLSVRTCSGWHVERPEKTIGEGCCDMALISPEHHCRVLIECKARRIARRVLSSPMPWSEAKSNYSDIIKGVSQIWRTAYLWEGPKSDVVGTILTLDPWMYLAPYVKELFESARELAQNKFGNKFLEIPLGFAASDDFERVSGKLETNEFVDRLVALAREERFGHSLQASATDSSGNEILGRVDPFDYNERLSQVIPWWRQTT